MSEQNVAVDEASAALHRWSSGAVTGLGEGLAVESNVGLTMLGTAADVETCTDGFCALPAAGAAAVPPRADR